MNQAHSIIDTLITSLEALLSQLKETKTLFQTSEIMSVRPAETTTAEQARLDISNHPT